MPALLQEAQRPVHQPWVGDGGTPHTLPAGCVCTCTRTCRSPHQRNLCRKQHHRQQQVPMPVCMTGLSRLPPYAKSWTCAPATRDQKAYELRQPCRVAQNLLLVPVGRARTHSTS